MLRNGRFLYLVKANFLNTMRPEKMGFPRRAKKTAGFDLFRAEKNMKALMSLDRREQESFEHLETDEAGGSPVNEVVPRLSQCMECGSD